MDVEQVKSLENPTRRHLSYTKTILKIPEYWKIKDNELYLLPCMNDYSVVRIYDTLFKILSALYDKNNLHNKVLLHVKLYRKYYDKVAGPYLNFKKLELIECSTKTSWLMKFVYMQVQYS